MPLVHSSSESALRTNIATEVRAGRPQAQAVAIGLSTGRRAWRRSHPKGPFPHHLRRTGGYRASRSNRAGVGSVGDSRWRWVSAGYSNERLRPDPRDGFSIMIRESNPQNLIRKGPFLVSTWDWNAPPGARETRKSFVTRMEARRFAESIASDEAGRSMSTGPYRTGNRAGVSEPTFVPTRYHARLGEELSPWSSGMDDIQVVASNLYAVKPFPRRYLLSASAMLEGFAAEAKVPGNAGGWTKKDARDLTRMAAHLRNLHRTA